MKLLSVKKPHVPQRYWLLIKWLKRTDTKFWNRNFPLENAAPLGAKYTSWSRMLKTTGFLNGKISNKLKIEMWDPIWVFSSCLILILLHHFSWIFSVGILVPFQFIIFFFIFVHACMCMCVLCGNLLTILTFFTNWNIFYFSCKTYNLYFSSQIWLKPDSGMLEIPLVQMNSVSWGAVLPADNLVGEHLSNVTVLVSFFVDNSYFLVPEFSLILYCYFPWIVTVMWKSS